MKRSRTIIPASVLVAALLLSFLQHAPIGNAKNTTQSNPRHLPVIYTYFERIPSNRRTTGMLDDDDDQLLEFWNETWSNAGWNPVLLTVNDAERHPDYKMLQQTLQDLQLFDDSFGRVLWHRWIAMADVGGGWYADYDVFPLLPFPTELPTNPNGMLLTVHDIASPTLASGSAEQWSLTLRVLLEDAKERHQNSSTSSSSTSPFWTDSLGITSLINNKKGPAPKTERRVVMPLDRNDPVISTNPADCSARNYRGRWAVHFGQAMVQMAKSVPPKQRHPKYRLALAKEWLPRWNQLCREGAIVSTTSTK
jgi:hypothetical protein